VARCCKEGNEPSGFKHASSFLHNCETIAISKKDIKGPDTTFHNRAKLRYNIPYILISFLFIN
jgi:hypothetical protein